MFGAVLRSNVVRGVRGVRAFSQVRKRKPLAVERKPFHPPKTAPTNTPALLSVQSKEELAELVGKFAGASSFNGNLAVKFKSLSACLAEIGPIPNHQLGQLGSAQEVVEFYWNQRNEIMAAEAGSVLPSNLRIFNSVADFEAEETAQKEGESEEFGEEESEEVREPVFIHPKGEFTYKGELYPQKDTKFRPIIKRDLW